ncbi:MAG TPA: hypothetical protein VD866_31810 [Urbifossiella sp.]|nr:hypothetical protein [Urbifossiella sp.]
MAKVVITVQDDGDEVDVNTEFDPPIKANAEVASCAQRLALVMVQTAFDMRDRESPDE